MMNTSIVIPVKVENEARRTGVLFLLRYLESKLGLPLVVLEVGSVPVLKTSISPKVRYFFQESGQICHYTKLYNDLVKSVDTELVIINNADCVFPVDSYLRAIETATSFPSLVRPYKTPYIKVDLEKNTEALAALDVSMFTGELCPIHPHGGCFVVTVDNYVKLGMANENIIGWGPDDKCLTRQAELSGIKNIWIDGPIYHLEHPRVNFFKQPSYQRNREEYQKICPMSMLQFEEYKKTWRWITIV